MLTVTERYQPVEPVEHLLPSEQLLLEEQVEVVPVMADQEEPLAEEGAMGVAMVELLVVVVVEDLGRRNHIQDRQDIVWAFLEEAEEAEEPQQFTLQPTSTVPQVDQVEVTEADLVDQVEMLSILLPLILRMELMQLVTDAEAEAAVEGVVIPGKMIRAVRTQEPAEMGSADV